LFGFTSLIIISKEWVEREIWAVLVPLGGGLRYAENDASSQKRPKHRPNKQNHFCHGKNQ
jgi:hypothetical protein